MGGILEISPNGPIEAAGPAGGSFEPASQVYTVRNAGDEPVEFAIRTDVDWLDFQPSGQMLAPGAEAKVTASIVDAKTTSLEPGVATAQVLLLDVATQAVSATTFRLNIEQKFDFYVDGTLGSDSNDGSDASPWKTLDKARAAAEPGSTIGVRSGNYGTFQESAGTGRSRFLTFKAIVGTKPVLSWIGIEYPTKTDCYLRIQGFEILGSGRSLVKLQNARHVQIIGCKIHATKWAKGGAGVDAFSVQSSEDVVLERNECFEVNRGLTTSNTSRLTIRRNYIRVKAGTGIQYAGGNEDCVIEFNHVKGDDYVGYPADPDAVRDPHASVVSVRSSDLTIRGNHMHGLGSSSGIMFYTPDVAGGETAYSNILIENNAIYDLDNTYALRMYNLGSNVVIRNNLLFSRLRTGTCNGLTGDDRYHYSNAVIVHNIAAGHSGSDLELYNNILIGIVSVPGNVTERNNLAWSWDGWVTTSPSGTSKIITGSYGGCGVHVGFFDNDCFAVSPNFAFPTKDPADWALKLNSLGIDFGDPTVQPTTSLGSIGPDGFLVDDGPRRSVNDHSVGPFEMPQ